jgi:CPA2 family monovalent cation:H+ antiporter-2
VAEIDDLLKVGADEVIPDELGAGLELAIFLTKRMQLNEGRLLRLLGTIRDEHHQRYHQADGQARNLTGYLSVLGGGEIEIQAVPDDSPHLGQTLAELDFRAATGATVVGVIRHERINYAPGPGVRLERGDTLMLLGETADIDRAREFLHGHPL